MQGGIWVHFVKCLYCDRTFDADEEKFVKPNKTRYAHFDCYQVVKKEEEDREELREYIKKIFNLENLGPVINKQIKSYTQDTAYGYTTKGIYYALKYFYEIKGNDTSKANNKLGIVPYVYDEAQKYFDNIDRANEINQKIFDNGFKYNIEVEEVRIPSPHRQERKRDLFSFLDEEVNDGQ